MAVATEKKSGSLQDFNDNGSRDLEQPVDRILCPPHTTETKLLAKIDMRVLPFLCIMYLLAFLGE